MWRILPTEKSIKIKYKKKYYTVHPVLTFSYGTVCKAHIVLDDHCYKVAIHHGEDMYDYTTYIFPDAFEVLKTLPNPSDY